MTGSFEQSHSFLWSSHFYRVIDLLLIDFRFYALKCMMCGSTSVNTNLQLLKEMRVIRNQCCKSFLIKTEYFCVLASCHFSVWFNVWFQLTLRDCLVGCIHVLALVLSIPYLVVFFNLCITNTCISYILLYIANYVISNTMTFNIRISMR